MAAFTNTTMLADTADVAGFMGANIDTNFTVTMQDLVGVYTEAHLCNLIKYDAVTNWATLSAIYKLMFSEYVARAIAVEAIKYNLHGLTGNTKTRIESEDQINIHVYQMRKIEKVLAMKGVEDFLGVNS